MTASALAFWSDPEACSVGVPVASRRPGAAAGTPWSDSPDAFGSTCPPAEVGVGPAGRVGRINSFTASGFWRVPSQSCQLCNRNGGFASGLSADASPVLADVVEVVIGVDTHMDSHIPQPSWKLVPGAVLDRARSRLTGR